jgi:succinate dehydrogenase/fumarate reductase-like Fe-S protein
MIKPVAGTIEDINIVLVGEALLSEVEQWLSACERCVDNAVITLDYVLDALTGSDPQVTEYMMCRPTHCPACSSQINEKTRVAV